MLSTESPEPSSTGSNNAQTISTVIPTPEPSPPQPLTVSSATLSPSVENEPAVPSPPPMSGGEQAGAEAIADIQEEQAQTPPQPEPLSANPVDPARGTSATPQSGASEEPQIAGVQPAVGQASAVDFPPADAPTDSNDNNGNQANAGRPSASVPVPPFADAAENAEEASDAPENELTADENQDSRPQPEIPPSRPVDPPSPSSVSPLLPPEQENSASAGNDEANAQGNANQLDIPPPQETDVSPIAGEAEQQPPPPTSQEQPPPEQEQPPPEQEQPSPPEQQPPPPPEQEQPSPPEQQPSPSPSQEQPPPEQEQPSPPEQEQPSPPEQEQPSPPEQQPSPSPSQEQPSPPEQQSPPPPSQEQPPPEQEQPSPPEQQQQQPTPENPPTAITDAPSSTTAVIGSAFGPPATTGSAEVASEDDNANQNDENGDTPGINAEDGGEGVVNDINRGQNSEDSGTANPISNESSDENAASAAAGTGTETQADDAEATSDPAADASNSPTNGDPANPLVDAAENAPINAPDSASPPPSPSGPIIPGLGEDFPGTTESDSSANSTDNDSNNAASTIAGIGGATSLVTSAIATQAPTGTATAGNAPTPSITRETTGGLNAISDAFSNPVTRTRSIGILVAAVVGFILIVALVAFSVWSFRRKRRDQQNGNRLSGDNEKGEMVIGNPVQTTQENIANYDPSAELMADSNGLDYGPSQPSQLGDALVNRAPRLSDSRKTFLDIYSGANTPYPQDVVDGSGRPLTQQFLMPAADKFQKELECTSPFSQNVSGLNSPQQRNISAQSNLSSIPENINPDQPAPFAGQEGPISPIDPALSNDGHFNQVQPDPSQDPFSDDNIAPLPPIAAAKMGAMKSQKQTRRGRTDSWVTVNTIATAQPGRNDAAAATAGLTRKPSHTDYTSVYMRNPFIDPPEASAAGGSTAPPVPAMPAIPKHLQKQQKRGQQGANRSQRTESVTLLFSPTTTQQQPQYATAQRQQQQTPKDSDDPYGGALDEYPPRPPSARYNAAGKSRGKSGDKSKSVRSNPFDLEYRYNASDQPAMPNQNQADAEFKDDGTVRSVQSWLSGIAEAERSRMERENVI